MRRITTKTVKTLSLLMLFTPTVASYGSAEGSLSPDKRLEQMQVTLPTPAKALGNYAHSIRDGRIIYLTGKGPSLPEGGFVTGKLGKDLNVEKGQHAARLTIIHLLGVLKAELGSLDKVEKIIKLNAAVNAPDDFAEHPKVVDGASNFLTEVFGMKIGQHARTVYGVNSLPFNIPIEIDMIVKVRAE